jgi:hypothetical protein
MVRHDYFVVGGVGENKRCSCCVRVVMVVVVGRPWLMQRDAESTLPSHHLTLVHRNRDPLACPFGPTGNGQPPPGWAPAWVPARPRLTCVSLRAAKDWAHGAVSMLIAGLHTEATMLWKSPGTPRCVPFATGMLSSVCAPAHKRHQCGGPEAISRLAIRIDAVTQTLGWVLRARS